MRTRMFKWEWRAFERSAEFVGPRRPPAVRKTMTPEAKTALSERISLRTKTAMARREVRERIRAGIARRQAERAERAAAEFLVISTGKSPTSKRWYGLQKD